MTDPTVNSPPRRVAHLTSVHPLDDTRITHKECRSLLEAGYDVVLIGVGPARSPYQGLRMRLVRRSEGRLKRMLLTTSRILVAAVKERADLYHLHDPELIPAGLVLKILGNRVIYDVHEHLPDQVLGKQWLHPAIRGVVSRLAGLLEMFADRAFDGIVIAPPGVVGRFRPAHAVLVQNFARLPKIDRGQLRPLSQRSVSVVYVGGITRDRGFWQMVEAIRLAEPKVGRAVIAGPLEDAIAGEDLSAVTAIIELPGRLSRNEVDSLLAESQVGLSVLQPTPNNAGSYTTKLFEYMSFGLPVVASDFPFVRKVIEAAQCGLLVDPTDPRAIADALSHLLDNMDVATEMGARGAAAAAQNYSWASAERELLDLYSRTLAGPTKPRPNDVPSPS